MTLATKHIIRYRKISYVYNFARNGDHYTYILTNLVKRLKVENKAANAVDVLAYVFLFSGHEPIYFIENKEKTLRASYDRGT